MNFISLIKSKAFTIIYNTRKNMNTLPKKLRAKQIADEFGIGLSTVWLYAKEGKLTPINVIPRVTVFDTAEVLKLFGEI